ncbi:hypothetical protein GLAREA_00221 [Glarea lozoyensis ATCC 20868]|uniref:Uncharacterized protein n=1 Tax=Glarea lozoyensis (strain ATCC 20868 / MF5171) TaxID=1116229 RepID=S3DRF9_GLAL2|nr:uncharacterized protein GLAREA_00221 [Glarea lozoyensis ATCC 20868]EPE29063.1 hypothetical protein GLAREA_00221 [Glarea lozoyensis ATCC 20868]
MNVRRSSSRINPGFARPHCGHDSKRSPINSHSSPTPTCVGSPLRPSTLDAPPPSRSPQTLLSPSVTSAPEPSTDAANCSSRALLLVVDQQSTELPGPSA